MKIDVESLSFFLINHFLGIWLLILIPLVAYTIITFTLSLRVQQIREKINNIVLLIKDILLNHLLSICLFGLFLISYLVLIIYKQDFANYDNDIFTEAVLKGYVYRFPIWPLVGRFFPLGHQEWHLWYLFTQSQSPITYYLFSTIQLIIIIFLVLKIIPSSSLALKFIIIALLLTQPSFFHCFDSLTIPERNLLLLLVIFIPTFQAYLQTGFKGYAGLILIVTQFALYYKEPVVIFFILFSFARLVYLAYIQRENVQAKWYDYVWKQAKLELGIIILCLIWIIFYSLVNLPYQSLDYATSRATNPLDTFLYYIKTNLLLVIFLMTISVKICQIILGQKSFDHLWDSLALGAIGYFAAYIKLGLINTYYLAPVDLIALLYVSQILITIDRQRFRKFMLLLFSIIILIQNLYGTPKIWIDRLNFIEGRAQITQFLQNYAATAKIEDAHLYFPYALSYQLYYLSCYLKYKNLSLTHSGVLEKNNQFEFMITSPLEFPDHSQCVEWHQDHHCFQVKSPKKGDLIIILPETKIDQQAFNQWQQNHQLLFEYKPFPKNSQMNAYIFQ